ncbi:MAG: alpha/beta fold hydrolase [Thiothrix sp.]|uniref:alpha/beta fold hydrolase n=1 Tax=Thiothrix sp. TaxID=1032 RepID=UPI00260595CC|nr:alpha/beta fold hydrolase [Thiothrix sp.]MDD5391582.1 alpha/beta fold hydrolase [Thiothrix sp.]
MVIVAGLGIASVHRAPLDTITGKTLANGARFVPETCWFDTGDNTAIQCGWLHTAPADSKHPSAFQLPVVIMRHTGMEHQPDPLVYLAGGPGAAAGLDKQGIESYWLDWFKQKADMKRDLILFDQRGTGLSKPALNCDEYRALSASILSNPGTPEENASRYRTVSQQCHDRLTQANLPLAALGTGYSAQDVNDLLELLDYPQGNLLGISYGTRLALEVQRQFPQRIRSLSLDSLYPPGEHLFRDWPELLDKSIQRIFQYCDQHERCQLENGDIRQRYASLMAKLRAEPLLIPVTDKYPGNLQTLRLNDEILLAILFDAQYTSHALASLPDMIRHLQEGHPELAQEPIENYLHHQFDDAFREPVFWSVECRDNPAVPRENRDAKINAYPELRYYLPHDYDVCDVWNAAPQEQGLQAPQAPRQTPSLIFSGEDDPITPTAWAVKAAAQQFSENTTHLFRFAGVAHSVMDSKECANALFIQFLNNPTERPRADCRFDAEEHPKHTVAASSD